MTNCATVANRSTDQTSINACASLQLTFTLVGPGGLTKTYSGPETLFNIVNAPPTMTPACQFTPVTKPSAYIAPFGRQLVSRRQAVLLPPQFAHLCNPGRGRRPHWAPVTQIPWAEAMLRHELSARGHCC